VLEIEVIGIEGIAVDVPATDELRFPTAAELKGLCALAISSAGIDDGHVAIEFVDAERIRELNRDHRQIDQPTDVLSFGVDGDGESAGPRELGDIVICPEHTVDVREAIVHGMLHLLGMDHETDDGEMLDLQRSLLERAAR
jgi:probable rRNA maturation factor